MTNTKMAANPEVTKMKEWWNGLSTKHQFDIMVILKLPRHGRFSITDLRIAYTQCPNKEYKDKK